MAIVHFTSDPDRIPEDAVNVRTQASTYRDTDGGQKEQTLYLWDSHVGLCLFEREINRYHDSDFYMVVWNPEKGEPERIFFATTRGWSYPAYASAPDATPEIRELYEAWRSEKDRKDREAASRRRKERLEKEQTESGLSEDDYWRLIGAVGEQVFKDRYLPLLRSDHHGRLRSDFRKSLAGQIRRWISQENPEYRRPLSPRQEMYL